LYPLPAGEVFVNLGFWGTVPLPPGCSDGHYNRRVEAEGTAHGGHKSLYSEAVYSPEQFWERYNGPAYAALKREYDGGGRLAGLYEKWVRGQLAKGWRGWHWPRCSKTWWGRTPRWSFAPTTEAHQAPRAHRCGSRCAP